MKKIILITGGSSGIGAEIARKAAKKDYIVCICYRQNKVLTDQLVQEITEQGGKIHAFKTDISKEKEVIDLFQKIDSNVGKITALVNNAAIIEPQQKLVDMSLERLQKVFATNVFGSFICAREAILRMSVKNGGFGGSIVNISSVASRIGAPFEYIDYAASKGAIDTMTLGLVKEVAADQIRVNAVRPGIIHTEIHAKAGEPGRIERVKNSIPMQRGGEPEEVANAVLWLLSEEASYVTGTLLDVAGGR
jgi:NAD(P)-dependent dehydrogenase (short-subunit alcohol dehydrogenase family)